MLHCLLSIYLLHAVEHVLVHRLMQCHRVVICSVFIRCLHSVLRGHGLRKYLVVIVVFILIVLEIYVLSHLVARIIYVNAMHHIIEPMGGATLIDLRDIASHSTTCTIRANVEIDFDFIKVLLVEFLLCLNIGEVFQ